MQLANFVPVQPSTVFANIAYVTIFSTIWYTNIDVYPHLQATILKFSSCHDIRAPPLIGWKPKVARVWSRLKPRDRRIGDISSSCLATGNQRRVGRIIYLAE